MPNATSYLRTVFSVSGQAQVIGATNAVATAQARMAQASATGSLAQQVAAVKNLTTTLRAAAQASLQLASAQFLGAGLIFGVIWKITDAYEKYIEQVRTAKELTGSTTQEAARSVLLMRATGLGSVQQAREMLRAAKDVFSGSGKGALQELGVQPDPSKNGLEIIGQISDALGRMKDGVRKTAIEQEIFGNRGIATMLPLLRLTKDQREQIQSLGDDLDETALGSVQNFRAEVGLLGQTVEQKLIFPMASQLIPVLVKVVNGVTAVTNWIGNLNKQTNGLVSAVAIFLLIGAAVEKLRQGVVALRSAYIAEAAAQALAGGPAGIAKFAASAAAIGAIAYGVNKSLDGIGSAATSSKDDSVNKFGAHVDRMGRIVDQMGDSFDNLKGKGIPSELKATDLSDLVIGAVGR